MASFINQRTTGFGASASRKASARSEQATSSRIDAQVNVLRLTQPNLRRISRSVRASIEGFIDRSIA